jgi:preprotein translocase subunit SecG
MAVLTALTISLGTANLLAYLMLVVVAIFLISGPIIVYIYYQKNKRERAAEPPKPA